MVANGQTYADQHRRRGCRQRMARVQQEPDPDFAAESAVGSAINKSYPRSLVPRLAISSSGNLPGSAGSTGRILTKRYRPVFRMR